MNLEDLKPDFEKIKVAMQIPESHSKFLYDQWDGIISGKYSYDIKNNIKLITLLKENNLESFHYDFLFLAFRCRWIKASWDELKISHSKISGQHEEFNQVLEFLSRYDLTDIKIDVKHRAENLSASIRHRTTIGIIFDALVEYFLKHDSFIEQGFLQPEEIQDLGKYLKFVIEEEKVENKHIKKLGRKRKHGSTAIMINFLQNYLQNYTFLKAVEGISISRGQSTFIYKFLSILDIIPDNLTWEEDNIRHILTKHRANKALKKPINMDESMDEYYAYAETMKAKIKNINWTDNSDQ